MRECVQRLLGVSLVDPSLLHRSSDAGSLSRVGLQERQHKSCCAWIRSVNEAAFLKIQWFLAFGINSFYQVSISLRSLFWFYGLQLYCVFYTLICVVSGPARSHSQLIKYNSLISSLNLQTVTSTWLSTPPQSSSQQYQVWKVWLDYQNTACYQRCTMVMVRLCPGTRTTWWGLGKDHTLG